MNATEHRQAVHAPARHSVPPAGSLDRRQARRFLLAALVLVVVGLLPVSVAAEALQQAASETRSQAARQAVIRALPLLQSSADVWFERRGCPSCHHQGLGMMAVSLARERGLPIDASRLANQIAKTSRERGNETEIQILGEASLNEAIGQSYRLLGLAAAGAPRGQDFSLISHMLAGKQHTSGRWSSYSHRPPLEDSELTATALSLRVLRLFPPEHRVEEMETRVSRARRWLLEATPTTTEEQVMQILGLVWSDADESQLRPLAKRLSSAQREDGGWAQIPLRESDAYATGQALVTLRLAGGAREADLARGDDFLVSTQQDDGSWLVTTRRTDADPGLPYFESGFPHGKHQFISYAGSAWATMALTLAATEGTHEALTGREPSAVEPPPRQGSPVPHVADLPALLRIALTGSLEELKRELAEGADPNVSTETGLTALHCAAHRPDLVAALLAAGARPDPSTESGHTPLIVAAGYDGAQESVRLLLDAGADVDAATTRGVLPLATAFLRAVQRGDQALATRLLQRGAKTEGGPHQLSPIHMATAQDDEEMVEFLLENGAGVDERLAAFGPPPGDTPLMVAASDGLFAAARLLVARGAAIDARDREGFTPLMFAVGNADLGTSEMVDLLMEAGADPLAKNAAGATALSLARELGVAAAISALEQAARARPQG